METTPAWLSELKAKINELDESATKFYEKGVKKEGPKSRKLLQDIKSLAQEARGHIQETTKSLSAKKA